MTYKTTNKAIIERFNTAKQYLPYFSKFEPENKDFILEYLFSNEKIDEKTRFAHILTKYPKLEKAFWDWTK